MLWILVTQISEGIDCIARLRHPKLHIAGPKVEMIRYRKLDHSQPVKLMDQRLLLFKWILRTDHKPNLIQVGAIVQYIGNDQVSDVDRIKASEIQSDLHLYFAKKSETKATASSEDRSKSSLRILVSN